MLEDIHRQIVINGVDLDFIKRTNDEGTEYTSFDVFYYEKQEYLHTSHDVALCDVLLNLAPTSFDAGTQNSGKEDNPQPTGAAT
ncbi:MAG: hypothetical protein QFB87_05625 [Patescibacteria group bacterium]|nr:hypothetical protein [Patescibacteria group bacterium]